MKKIRVGIIGFGRSGRDIHGRAIGMLPETFQIVAVNDPYAERRERAASEFGCSVYEDYKALLGRTDLDLVINATPSHLHVPVTTDVLEAGFNVMCEKPLARSSSDVKKLIAKSKEKGKLLAIFQQMRFSPQFRELKKIISSGVLGRMVLIKMRANSFGRRWDWQTLRKYDGGSLLNTGPHSMDQALQLFGTDAVPEVTCFMDSACSFGDAEDHVKVLLRGPGKPVIDLEISSCCAYPTDSCQIHATNGGLSGSETHLEWKYFKPEEAPERTVITEPMEGYCSEELKWYTESWDLPEGINAIDHSALCFYRNLYDVLANGAPLEVLPEHILQQICVMEECHRQQ